MKTKDFKKIKRFIYCNIKPKNCQVIYCNDNEYHMTYYDCHENVCMINRKLHKSNISYLHAILHEICHAITFKDKWRLGKYGYYLTKEKIKLGQGYVLRWRPHSSDRYMSEYAAEKLLRNICRQYSWNELLKYSNKHLIKYWQYYFSPPKFPNSGYYYAFKRISREENVQD